jgi:hypothetical protein
MVWHAIKNYGAKLLAGYIDGAINVAKSFAMNAASALMDQWGVRQVVNDVMKFTKPDVIMAKYGKEATDWLNDQLGLSTKEELYETYFGDYRQAEPDKTKPTSQYIEPGQSAKTEEEDAQNEALGDKQYFTDHRIAGQPTTPKHQDTYKVEQQQVKR